MSNKQTFLKVFKKTVADSAIIMPCLCRRKRFPPGANIIFDGDDYICEDCDQPPPTSNERYIEPPPVTRNIARSESPPREVKRSDSSSSRE